MNKYYYLFILVIFFNCSEKEFLKVEITYNDLSKLNTESYLKIDNHILPHTSSAKAIRYHKALPLSYINMFDSKQPNAPVIKTKKNMVLEGIRDMLLKTDEYKFDSIMYIEKLNKIIFSRKDGKSIKIKHSDNYPANFISKK